MIEKAAPLATGDEGRDPSAASVALAGGLGRLMDTTPRCCKNLPLLMCGKSMRANWYRSHPTSY
jgi:hypothetical protein